MPPTIEPQAAVKLADTLLSTFYEVEKLAASSPYDASLVALLIAGASEAIEDEVKFDYPIRSTGDETNLSRAWLHMLMDRNIRQLSALKSGLLSTSPEEREAEKPVRLFLCILVDVCSLLASPTLRVPLEEYFAPEAAEP